MGRDDFSMQVKRQLAERASFECSAPGCRQRTIGPGAESETQSINVGFAAHITAASPGGKRYDATLTAEQRSSFGNGIWLCGHHGALVDKDDISYPVELLRAWKAEHEARIEAMVARVRGIAVSGKDLIALGPSVVATGEMVAASGAEWTLRLDGFVFGGVDDLTDWRGRPANDRYVLVSSRGEGRVVFDIGWSRLDDGRVKVVVYVEEACKRTTAHGLKKDFALDDDGAGDLNIGRGGLRMIGGVERLPQYLTIGLGVVKGRESDIVHPELGSLLSEYFALYRESPLFPGLVKLEVIRLASLPRPDDETRTQLACVQRVMDVQVLATELIKKRLSMRVVLEVAGVGRWERELKVFIKSPL